MTIRRFLYETLVVGVTAVLASLAVLVAIRLVLSETVTTSDIVASALLVLFLLGIAFYALLRHFVGRLAQRKLAAETGIVETYPNLAACEGEIIALLAKAERVDILLQIGTTVLAGPRTIYQQMEEEIKWQPGVNLRLMFARDDSPHLSAEAAIKRGSDRERWMADLRHAEAQVALLNKKVNLQVVRHREPFLWRLFIIDDVAFIQPYYFHRDNSAKAGVLKVSAPLADSPSPQSLYRVVTHYYETVCSQNTPRQPDLSELLANGSRTVVICIPRMKGCFLFVVPRRKLTDPSAPSIAFHATGGKVKEGESLAAALKRECSEELELTVDAADSTEALHFGYGLVPRTLAFPESNAPRPRWIEQTTRDVGTSYVVGFSAQVRGKLRPKPRSEVGASLLLSPDLLRRAFHRNLTIADIRNAHDGSKFTLAEAVQVSDHQLLVPGGIVPRVTETLLGSAP